MKAEPVDPHVILFSVIQLERLAVLFTTAQLGEFLVCFEPDTESVGVRFWCVWIRLYVVPAHGGEVGRLRGMVLGVRHIEMHVQRG